MSTTFSLPRTLRPDDVFFPAMGFLILSVVVLGFAQTYFFAGMLRAQLPSTLVHIHGALFVSWIFLVTIQPLLVAMGKVTWHKTLGVFGVILPPLLVVFGVLTLFAFIRRTGADADVPPELLLTGDLEELALFVVLTSWGLLVRRQAASHKRLMIMGTMAMLGPAIARWPIPFSPLGTICIQLGLPLLVVIYDLWSSRRVHRSTTIAFAMIAVGLLAVLPVSGFGFWQLLVAWIRHA
jgi:hypothetical protein